MQDNSRKDWRDHINLSAIINNVDYVNDECSKIRNIYLKCLETRDVGQCNKIFSSFLNVCDKHNTLSIIARQRYI